VAVTPDGRRILSGGSDTTVRVWELATGRLERPLKGHACDAWELAVTPDGRRVVSLGRRYAPLHGPTRDDTIRIWNLDRGRIEQMLEGTPVWELALAISPDGSRLFTGGKEFNISVWDLASGRLLYTIAGHTGPVGALAISPDGRRLVSGGSYPQDSSVRVWDLATSQLVHTLDGHTDRVTALAVTSDSRRAVSIGGDHTLRVWDLAAGQEVASWRPDPGVEARACCTVPTDPSLVVYGDATGFVHLLQLVEKQA